MPESATGLCAMHFSAPNPRMKPSPREPGAKPGIFTTPRPVKGNLNVESWGLLQVPTDMIIMDIFTTYPITVAPMLTSNLQSYYLGA